MGQTIGMRLFWMVIILATIAAVIASFALPDITDAG
jgi:K+ transporter